MLFLLIDTVVFRWIPPWDAWIGRLGDVGAMGPVAPWLFNNLPHRGVLQDRWTLQHLAGADLPGRPIYVLGSSRTERGIRPALLDASESAGQRFVILAHPLMNLVEIHAASQILRRHRPAVVVIGLSDIDTHALLELDDRNSFRNVSTFVELSRFLGWRWALEHRVRLLRIVAGDLIATYRYRGLLGGLGLDALRRFEGALPGGPALALERLLAEEMRMLQSDAPDARKDPEGGARNPGLFSSRRPEGFPVQSHLLRRSVERFRSRGSEVLIVELPAHPSLGDFRGSRQRAAHLALIAELQQDYAIHTLPLEAQPAYGAYSFADIMHLNDIGAEELTRALLARLREIP